MKPRKKIMFRVDGKLVMVNNTDLFLNQIDEMKHIIASEYYCHIDEVSVETIYLPLDLSDFDVCFDGIINWKDPDFKTITGVKLNLIVGSNEHLDAINNGTLGDYLIFI